MLPRCPSCDTSVSSSLPDTRSAEGDVDVHVHLVAEDPSFALFYEATLFEDLGYTTVNYVTVGPFLKGTSNDGNLAVEEAAAWGDPPIKCLKHAYD